MFSERHHSRVWFFFITSLIGTVPLQGYKSRTNFSDLLDMGPRFERVIAEYRLKVDACIVETVSRTYLNCITFLEVQGYLWLKNTLWSSWICQHQHELWQWMDGNFSHQYCTTHCKTFHFLTFYGCSLHQWSKRTLRIRQGNRVCINDKVFVRGSSPRSFPQSLSHCEGLMTYIRQIWSSVVHPEWLWHRLLLKANDISNLNSNIQG